MVQNLGKGEREVQTIIGRAGNGKTTLLRELLRSCDRALVFDPLRVMYPGLVLNSADELDTWIDLHGDNPAFRLIYRPEADENDYDGMKQCADHICFVARNLGNLDVLFDEVDTFSRSEDDTGELFGLINFGRRHNISVRGTVRRPQVNIPRYWVTETTKWTIFQTCDPLDLSFIKRSTGIEPEDVVRLEQFEFIQWSDSGEIFRGKLKNPYERGAK